MTYVLKVVFLLLARLRWDTLFIHIKDFSPPVFMSLVKTKTHNRFVPLYAYMHYAYGWFHAQIT